MAERTCSFDGCERPYRARGWCQLHYDRWKRSLPMGATTEDLRRVKRRNLGPCSTDGCDAPSFARELCKSHYTKAKNERWRMTDPDRLATYKLARYGLTREDYDRILEAQGARCAICGVLGAETGRALAVDHNYRTGRVRGLLCVPCNCGIGQLRDDPERARRATEYLAQDGSEVARTAGRGVNPHMRRAT